MLVRLAPETTAGAYRIRPPRGYSLERRAKNGGEFYQWKGQARGDGSYPQLLLTFIPVPPEGRNAPAEVIFDAVMDGCRKGQAEFFPTWNMAGRESGRINGIPFLRTRISGANGALRMTGFAYMALDQDNVIFFLSQDLVPHDGDSLRVAEASTLTLKR
jgi:hypothetical protein